MKIGGGSPGLLFDSGRGVTVGTVGTKMGSAVLARLRHDKARAQYDRIESSLGAGAVATARLNRTHVRAPPASPTLGVCSGLFARFDIYFPFLPM